MLPVRTVMISSVLRDAAGMLLNVVAPEKITEEPVTAPWELSVTVIVVKPPELVAVFDVNGLFAIGLVVLRIGVMS